jgi:hypothetical protein
VTTNGSEEESGEEETGKEGQEEVTHSSNSGFFSVII